jgi:hypothetical protein
VASAGVAAVTTRRELRVALGPAAVLPVAEAIERLPWREADARRWLHDRGLVRERPDLPGPVVVWADVIDELRVPLAPVEDAPRRTLRRGGVR